MAIPGGAPALRDGALLAPEMTVAGVDGFALSGGSAFGLDAAGGVMAYLAPAGRGLAVGAVLRADRSRRRRCSISTTAATRPGAAARPIGDLGFEAAASAGLDFALGTAGAGYGATTYDLKGGLGSASATSSRGFIVGALVAVNAVGRATRGTAPHFWAARL